MLEEIAEENEQLELLANQRLNYVRMLAIERNQAKSELEQLHLERSTMNAEVFDTTTLIPSPTDFGDLRCLFKRSFNKMMFRNVPPLIMRGKSHEILQMNQEGLVISQGGWVGFVLR